MKQVTKTLYTYGELSEEVKEKVRNELLEDDNIADGYWDYVKDNQGGILITKDEMKLLSGVLSDDQNVIETGNGDGSYCTFFEVIMDNSDIVDSYTMGYGRSNIIFAIEDDSKGSLEKLEARIIETFEGPASGIVDEDYLDEEIANNGYWFDSKGNKDK